MASAAQITANRANASHSTGPKTEAGKAASSQNGVQHGLASSKLIISGESQAEFDAFEAALLAEHKPAGITETLLVQDMAKHHWLANRAIRLQNEQFEKTEGAVPATLGVLIRYQTTNERAFHKALATLLSLRKAAQQAQKSEDGFASQAKLEAVRKEADRRLSRVLGNMVMAPTPGELHAQGWQFGSVDVETGEFTSHEE